MQRKGSANRREQREVFGRGGTAPIRSTALIVEGNVFRATPQLGEAMNRAIADANAWLDEAPADTTTGSMGHVN